MDSFLNPFVEVDRNRLMPRCAILSTSRRAREATLPPAPDKSTCTIIVKISDSHARLGADPFVYMCRHRAAARYRRARSASLSVTSSCRGSIFRHSSFTNKKVLSRASLYTVFSAACNHETLGVALIQLRLQIRKLTWPGSRTFQRDHRPFEEICYSTAGIASGLRENEAMVAWCCEVADPERRSGF
jgi:hypothetical protein